MFSRLCKNAIFPLSGAGNNGNNGGDHHHHNSAGTAHSTRNPARNATVVDVEVNGDVELLRRREPPPPYWVHHHHRRPSSPVHLGRTSPTPALGALDVAEASGACRTVGTASRPLEAVATTDSDSDNEQQQHRDPILLDKRIFCPDLLNTCRPSSTESDPNNSASSHPQTTHSGADADYDDDANYAHIDDVRAQFAAFDVNDDNNAPTNESIADEPPPPEIPPRSNRIPQRPPAPYYAALIGNAHRRPATSDPHPQQLQDMGQSLSQRRPRLSLTWVLRDQQQQQQQQSQQQQQQHQAPNNGDTNGLASTIAATGDRGPAAADTLVDGIQQPGHAQSDTAPAAAAQSTPTATTIATTLEKKLRFRSKSKDCVERLFSEKYSNFAVVAEQPTSTGGIEVPPHRADAMAAVAVPPPPPPVSALNTAALGGRLMFVCSKTRDVTSCLGYDSDYGECSGGGGGGGGNSSSATAVVGTAASVTTRRSVRMRAKSVVKRAASKLSFRDNLNNNSLTEKTIVCEKLGLEAVSGAGGANGAVDCGKQQSVVALGMKSTYSEPALSVGGGTETVIGQSRRHRHRRRRERNRSQRFGYEIRNVDDFLSKCSLSSPGNIPVVLSAASTLYQTRPGGYQIEIPLPLGMVVNAVFKNQNWLYVQTPHAEEGYVGYATCLPLGILPQSRPTPSSKPTPCWETNGDVFPKPCGNMTDSEKEIHMRVGTQSEGTRTPRLRRTGTTASASTAANNNNTGGPAAVQQQLAAPVVVVGDASVQQQQHNAGAAATAACGERHLDVLYLRATASVNNGHQPKQLVDKMYAQLKPKQTSASANYATSGKANLYHTIGSSGSAQSVVQQQHRQQQQLHHYQQVMMRSNCSSAAIVKPQAVVLTSADDYVLLQNHHQIQQQQQLYQQQQHQKIYQKQQQQQQQQQPIYQSTGSASVISAGKHSVGAQSASAAANGGKCSMRQTLLAITDNYVSGTISVHKGDVVTLLACQQVIDARLGQPVQWFFVRSRDGTQGYIPAEVAGHGFL